MSVSGVNGTGQRRPTMKEVAATLGVSPRTVETHKYQSMEALRLKTTAELIRYALEHGLTTPPAPA